MDQRCTSHADALRKHLDIKGQHALGVSGLDIFDEEASVFDEVTRERSYPRLGGWNALHGLLREEYREGRHEVLGMPLKCCYIPKLMAGFDPPHRQMMHVASVERGSQKLALLSIPELDEEQQVLLPLAANDFCEVSGQMFIYEQEERQRLVKRRLLILASPLRSAAGIATALRLAL